MLAPLFDKACTHVGWMERGKYILAPDMSWLAYIDGGNVWSAAGNEWLGPVNGVICMDSQGLVVAWGIGQKLIGDPYPHRKPARTPKQPLPPQPSLRPMVPTPPLPAAPLGGWSGLSFQEWTTRNISV